MVYNPEGSVVYNMAKKEMMDYVLCQLGAEDDEKCNNVDAFAV